MRMGDCLARLSLLLALATLALLLSACSGKGDPVDSLPDTVEGDSTGAYSDIETLIADVEDAGFTCWKWKVDGDNSLLGAAASASCVTEDQQLHTSEGRIALFSSTETRDSTVDFALTDGGWGNVVVGPNYYVVAENEDRDLLQAVADKLDGADVRTSEFDVN